jgi:long-chain acyl-CoA synthetase
MGRLLSRAVTAPDAPAITDDTATSSWAELDRRVNRWIDVLRGHGLSVGDRVGLVTSNRTTTFEALLACLQCGLVAVPISYRLTAPEIAYLLADSGSRAVVSEPLYASRVAAALAGLELAPVLALVTGREPVARLGALEKVLAGADPTEPGDQLSGSVMLYTSATTGRPKGVNTSLFSLGAELSRIDGTTAALGRSFNLPQEGNWLLAGPWYHSAQLFFSLFPLLRGARLQVRRRFDAADILADLSAGQICGLHLVPTQMIRLLALEPALRNGFDGAGLRQVWHGGAACPPEVKAQMIDWWGPVISEYYAATEAGIVTTISSEESRSRPGSVGRAAGPNEVLVLDPDGEPCPPGVSGKIYVRRSVKLDFAYHNDPAKTAAAHRSAGTFTVGDLGRLDEDGYLYLTGRSHDMIISGGVNIYPAEVEAVLMTYPGVGDVAVLGVPDPEYGEQVVALVELDETGDLAEEDVPERLDTYCRDQLAAYKRPRHYQVLRRLPREPTGKLDKHRLRELAAPGQT